jgi:cellulose synthase/poly-beta-1,6-N-acetylglucosamine synthase-like glycosyltransferase
LIARLAFWGSAAWLGFVLVGAPLLIVVRGWIRPRPIRRAASEPTVAVGVAARNEAERIATRLDNLLSQDYPQDRLEVVIASDGSEDRTVAIATERATSNPGRVIRVLELPRVGKADALNAAIATASAEIVVFTDANSRFATDAIRRIVEPFADERVGGVAGNQVYLPADGSVDRAVGERDYWDLDRWVKEAESRAGSTISATGAIYAIRRELVPTVRSGVTDDFWISTAVVAADRRLVFEPSAIAFEPPAPGTRREYGRKVRIMTRGLRGVAERRALLDPRRSGFYSLQLAWHKVFRRLMAIPLLILGASSAALAADGPIYALAALGQVVGYGLAAVGLARPASRVGRSRPAALAAFFAMINVASIHAALNLIAGRRIERWEPARDAGPLPPTADSITHDESGQQAQSATSEPTGMAR